MGCKIVRGPAFDCENPLQGGVGADVYVFNIEDFVSVTKSGNLVTAVNLANNTTAYKFSGFNTSVTPQVTLRRGSLSVTWDHQVQLGIFDISQDQKDDIQRLAFGKGVGIIVQNLGGNATNKAPYEIYGIGNGLILQECSRLPADVDTGGAWTAILKSSDDRSGEAELPVSWFDTDVATTKTAVEALASLPKVFNVTPIAAAVAGGTALTVTGENFFGGGTAEDISSVALVNNSTQTATTQTESSITDTQFSIASTTALVAGTYFVRVTTSKGTADGDPVLVVS